MRYIFLFMIVQSLLISCEDRVDIPVQGVPLELAEKRKNNTKDIAYKLEFRVPADRNEDILAETMIRFDLELIRDVYLDFKEEPDHLISVKANGNPIDIQFQDEHIRIPKKNLTHTNEIEISFTAGNLSLNRNDDYLYTLLVPDRARTVFPVFDQPNLKARYSLALSIPIDWEAVANGPLSSERIENETKVLTFKETKPIPTYLFAFAAGKFQKLKNKDGNMTMYFRETDVEKVERNAPEIFQLHRAALDWLEEYTGIEYPFQKFDFALIPTFQYGGMEHPGAIFYRERSLMLDESPSINQQLSRASLIAHETAHMWFGDLVTMDWFNDVWLKEVFANFYAAKIVNPSFPEVNHDLRFLLAHYPRAYRIDRTKGSHPIQQRLDNLQDAGSLYGPIIYQKAPIVMRQLEEMLGELKFKEGIRTYLTTYSFDNATWDDLIDIMDQQTEQDLQQWNQDWIKSPGMPEINVIEQENTLSYVLQNDDNGNIWPQMITTSAGKEENVLKMNAGGTLNKISEFWIPNVDGKAYAYFDLEKEKLSGLLLDMQLHDETTRAAIWMMQWESFLRGKHEVREFYQILLDAITVEYNPLIISYLSSNLNTIFWRFMDQEERKENLENTEWVLFDKMMKTPDLSIKRNLFNSYRSMALSPQGVNILKSIWNDALYGFSLPLSENNYISLAYALSIRDADEAQEILNEQLLRIKNEDNRKKMNYIMPSVSSDQSVRDSMFQSLLLSENREQEPWVSEALGYLHHPLRSEKSIQYILPSLEIIEEIKATGDIFFPAAWLNATLGGHNSDEALTRVNTFLSENPSLPLDLRNKILQAADILEWAVELRKSE